MSFDALETSIAAGRPSRLYDFALGASHFRYTSADRDIVAGGAAWLAQAGLSDGGKNETGEPAQETFQITAPLDFELGQFFTILPPSQVMTLRVLEVHAGDDHPHLYWIGQVTKVVRLAGSLQVNCESIVSASQVLGLRLSWQRGCPHTVYDSQCKVALAAFRADATLTTVTSATIEAAEFAAHDDGYFTGGFVQFPVEGGRLERRMIQAHAGGVLQLLGTTWPLAPADVVSAFPGCSYDPTTCNDKFGNLPNYGGVPGLPGISPFIKSPFV